MAIDPRILDLMHADIDGEISAEDKAELESLRANDADVQAQYAELERLTDSLDQMPELDAPPHLKHTIMAAIPAAATAQQQSDGDGLLQTLFASQALRYAAMFAAGAVLTLSLVSSDRASRGAFDDVTGLVGTISDTVPAGPGVQFIEIARAEIAGTIALRSSGPILIVDFDLVSSGPIDIVAAYSDQSIWFNGFAQLQSPGASIAAESGQITMQVKGKRRYALYLHNAGDRDINIDLEFLSDGAVVYDTTISYDQRAEGG